MDAIVYFQTYLGADGCDVTRREHDVSELLVKETDSPLFHR